MDSKPSLAIASFTLTCKDEGKSLTRGWVGNSDPCCNSWWATIINAASTVEAGLFKFPFTALYFLWGGYQIWGPGECKHPLLSVTVEQRLNAVTSKHGRYLPETQPGQHPRLTADGALWSTRTQSVKADAFVHTFCLSAHSEILAHCYLHWIIKFYLVQILNENSQTYFLKL